MTAAEKYVACAYLVVFLAVLAYVLIIALNIARLEQTLRMLEAAAPTPPPPPEATTATGTNAVVQSPSTRA
jgi:hypothetical protein